MIENVPWKRVMHAIGKLKTVGSTGRTTCGVSFPPNFDLACLADGDEKTFRGSRSRWGGPLGGSLEPYWGSSQESNSQRFQKFQIEESPE